MTEVSGLVSVIIPFFNPVERFLREAVESVVSQTYRDWEIILVDDGSQEGAGSRSARALAAAMRDRIRLVTHDQAGNRGASAARNEGLRHANGTYVSFLDADDVWLPDKLKIEVAALDAEPTAGMAYSSYLYWYSWAPPGENTERDWVAKLGVEAGRPVPPPAFLTLFLRGMAAVPMLSTFRKDVLEAVGGFEDSFPGLYDDQVLFAKVGLRYPVVPLQQLTLLYRRHDRSICATANADMERRERARFLSWLSDYVEHAGVFDPDLRAAIRKEAWNIRNPRLARVSRWFRKLAHRRVPCTGPERNLERGA